MSLEAYTRVWQKSNSSLGARLVMLALANEVRPSHNKPICWPGKDFLAAQANLDKRTVDHAIKALEAMGEIRIIPDRELDVCAKQSMEKLGTSNLYILRVGEKRSTLESVEAWLRGGKLPPPQNARGHPVQEGVASCPSGGWHPATQNRIMDGTGTEPEEHVDPPEWVAAGVRVIWELQGRRLVGEIAEDADGQLRLVLANNPSRPYLCHLAGHLEPATDPPDRQPVEASGS